MKAWLLMLSGLLVWAVHFFGIYVIASVLPGSIAARWLVAALTLGCLAAAILFIRLLVLRKRGGGDDLDRWVRLLGLSAWLLSLPAIVFQALPSVLP